ncbi:MAG: radical SAM protein [Gemmatimonadota bacterium]|nr:radical SAM protein [Gemmatimonadota bacterium]
MRIALLNPPSYFLMDQKAFLPLSLLYLAGYIRERSGHQVEIHDLAGREDELERALAGIDADLYCVTATTPQYPAAREILDLLHSRSSRAKVILGGVHATSVPELCLADGWDHVVIYEGEQALLALAGDLEKERYAPKIFQAEYISDIDTIPFPATDLIDCNEYGYNIDGHKAMTLITSRGCPFNCAFCSKEVWQRTVRLHSPDYIETLVRHLKAAFHFNYYLFVDDNLTLNKKRLLEIMKRLEPLGIKWRCYAHVRTTDRDMVRAMKRAGCIEIGVGIESGSQKILDTVAKGTSVEGNTAFLQMCSEESVEVNAFIMIGLPGETEETVAETRAWMENVRPGKFGYNIFMPYYGTPVFQCPEKYDIRILPMPDEKTWVKGPLGENNVFVETSGLSQDRILELFKENFKYFTELINWTPGANVRPNSRNTSSKAI